SALSGTIAAGNGNGVIDPGECDLVNVIVSNTTAIPMSGITAILNSVSPGVAVLRSISSYLDIPAFGEATNLTPFELMTSTNFPCGQNVNLNLAVATTTHNTFAMPLTFPTGSPGCAPGNGICDQWPDITITSALGSNAPSSVRLSLSSIPSTCSNPKVCPGLRAEGK